MSQASIDLGAWGRRRVCDGIVFVEPNNRARLRIRLRVPAARLDAVIAEVVDSHGVAFPAALEQRRLVLSGELGVLAVGRTDAGELAVAIVGDGPLVCVDAVGEPGTGLALMVESLVQSIGLGRGVRRVRKFEYEPPRGWRGMRRVGATLWLHPDTPRASASITVHDARPLSSDADERLHRRLFLRVAEREGTVTGDPVVMESDFGLSGRVRESRIAAAGLVRKAAAFGDDRFMYLATLAAHIGDRASIVAFDQLLRSFRPLPSLSVEVGAGLEYLAD